MLREIFTNEPRLIKLPCQGKAVFVGDTHGDVDASKWVLDNFLNQPEYYLVFLGDYIDRGPHSKENLELLLEAKQDLPERLFLLMGNHEGQGILPFYPADFWESLEFDQKIRLAELFKDLPLAAISPNGVLALHGVPPNLNSIEEINQIRLGSKAWQQVTWGDFSEEEGDFLGEFWGRPLYGRGYFERIRAKLGFSVLIRAHQPYISPVIFEGRCLTLMTSVAYGSARRIAILDLSQEKVESVKDLKIIEI